MHGISGTTAGERAIYRLRVSGREGQVERRGLQSVRDAGIALCEAYGGLSRLQFLPSRDADDARDAFYLVDLLDAAQLPLAATLLGVGTYGGALLIQVERIDGPQSSA
jgi:hypothetical protein